jgi:hypothetical protein
MIPRFFLLLLLIAAAAQSRAQSAATLIPFKSGDKWGYLTPDKRIAIEPQYDTALPFTHGVARVGQRGKGWGLLNTANQLIAPIAQQEFFDVGGGLFFKDTAAGEEGKIGIVDSANHTLIPTSYDLITPLIEMDVFEIQLNHKNGICTRAGNVVIPPAYDFFTDAGEQNLIVQDANSQAMFSLTGRQLTPFKYMVIGGYRYRRAKMRVGDLFGYLDPQGHEIIPPAYQLSLPFSEGNASVESGGKWGSIDTAGHWVISPIFDYLGSIDRGVATAKTHDKWALVDPSGKQVTTFDYQNIHRVRHGAIIAGKKDKWTILSPTGRQLTPFDYDTIMSYSHLDDFGLDDFGQLNNNESRFLLVRKGGSWGVIDQDGKEIIPALYDEQINFGDGRFAALKKDGKYALADTTGALLTDFTYDGLQMETRLAVFKKGNIIGILDRKGKPLASGYDGCFPADDPYIVVIKQGRMGVIDETGTVILPPKYDRVRLSAVPGSRDKNLFVSNLCQVILNGTPGFVAKDGTEYFK